MNKVTAKLGDTMVRIARCASGLPGCSLGQAGLARTALVTLLVLVASVSAAAQAEQEAQARCLSTAPAFTQMTYDEDNLYFSDPACHTLPMDSLKFIRLRGDDDDYHLSLGIWLRERGEYVSNPNWSATPPGNIYSLQRYILHGDLHLGERFRFFAELASSLEYGRNGGPRPGLDKETFYVHQGFFDLGFWRSGNDSLTLRAGRHEMILGSENLVSTRDGRNIRRSFDGFRPTWLIGNWTVDAFALKPVRDNPGIFDDPPSPESSFWGVYAVSPFPILPQGHVDLYYMGIENKAVLFDGKGSGRERRQTIGTRLWGTAGPWDYNNELTFQFGRFGPDNILAWAVSTETGYRIASIPLKPRLVIRAGAYSGDQTPSSGTLGTFNSLFEKGPYFSYAEVFARRNLIVLQPFAQLELSKTVSLTLNPAFFWRESTRDGLYSIAGGVLVTGQTSTARYIATQASVQLQWRVNRNVTLFTEYAHFFPAEFLRQSTQGRNINYWTGWLDIRY
jgi:hypothetical protein